MKSFLFIMRNPPYDGVGLQEKLDVILTAAAFDQKVALLFLDDGIFQLKKGQQPEKQGINATASIFGVLEMYDINDLYIEVESLQERGIKVNDLSLLPEQLCRRDVNQLMQQFDILI